MITQIRQLASCETINYSDSSGITIKAFYKFHVRVLMYHQYYNSLTVKFLSTLSSPSTKVSFGLNNLVFYSNDSLQITSSISAANFPCYENSYWTGAACVDCHDYCSVCTGPSNNECDACRAGFYSYYNRTCLDTCNAPFTPIINTMTYNHCKQTCPTDFYWFYNKSCSTSCDAPLTQSTDSNGLKICSNPCYYNDAGLSYINTYLYPDKTCDTSCSSPAVKATPYLCETPCTNSNNYAFQNGSCTDNCGTPLVDSKTKGIFYCDSPCPGEYIYPSGTCETDCASPLVKVDDSTDIKWCVSPCESVGDYAYINGSCTGTCVALLVSSTVEGIKYCNSPCPGEYIYPSGTCETSCPSILVSKDDSADIKFCRTPCESVDDFVFQNGSCTITCTLPLLSPTVEGILYCNSPCPGKYIYPDGTCQTDCASPLIKKDDSADIKWCVTPCESVDDYAYINGSCTGTCGELLVSSTVEGIKYCNSPCPGEYIYPSGTCETNCASPLVKQDNSADIKWCVTPCGSVDDYAYLNGSCTGTCGALLVSSTVEDIKYCNSPCPGEYIYPSGACETSCPSILVSKDDSVDIKFCRTPCESVSDSVFQNGSCTSTCTLPLLSPTVDGILYCNSPCPGKYIYPSGTCETDCASPLMKKDDSADIKWCVSPCESVDDYAYLNGSCTAACGALLVSSTVEGIKYCNSPCPGEYIYPSGTCETSCPSFLVAKDDSADIKFCRTLCESVSDFVFQNGSCTSACTLPLLSLTVDGIKYCNSPCPGKYIYPSGTCQTDCASPLMKKDDSADIKFCETPCNDYVFQNGSCTSNCESPLVGSTVDEIKYCNSPCPGEYIYPDGTCEADCALVKKEDSDDIKLCLIPCENSNDYYFTDGTCDSICPFPLEGKTEAGIKYCYNPCTISGTYLYDNGTCLSTCPSPYVLRTKSMGKFCNFPCSDTALYFYLSDGSCQATCVYPNLAVESPLPKTCTLGLSEDDVEEVKKLAGVTDTVDAVSSGGILLISLLSSSDSTSICMGPFSKMLQYIRFLDIVYPAKVQLMLESRVNKSNIRGFTSKMIGGILDGFPENDELPAKFEQYRTLSSFFVNFWPALFNLLVILLAISMVLLTRRWSRACLGVNKIVKSVEERLKWNVLLITFCGNFCDIFLFTALEFHTTKFTNIQGPISFVLCLIINLAVMFVVIKILEVNFSVRKSRREFKQENLESQEEQLTKEWCNWSALFVAYKDQAYSQQIFLFIFLARLAFFGSVIGYLYEYPLTQAIMINLANISILLYLGIKRPMKQIASFLQQTVLELVLLPFNLCVLILAILDAKGINAYDERNRIGSVMVYINLITPLISAVLMGIKFLFIGFTVYKQWKASKNKKKNVVKSVKRVKRENVSLAVGNFPQKVQARPLPPQNRNNQQLFRQISSQNGIERSSVLDISSSSFNASTIVNQDNSNSSFVFHQTRSPRRKQQQMISNSSLLRPPPNDSSQLTIQHHHSSPQRSVFSTGMMSMSQILVTGSPGSPNLHRKIARRKNPAVMSSRKVFGLAGLENL